MRDRQRQRVYDWERDTVQLLTGHSIYEPDFTSLQQCNAFAAPIWSKERGRVRAPADAPQIERPNRGQKRARAHGDHRITLPKWTRSRWMILHELSHRLCPSDEPHGPRFVGVLIGLIARWMDLDAQRLMRLADAAGVLYHVRSIGVLPQWGATSHVARAVELHGPMSVMELSCHLAIFEGLEDINPGKVRGAALQLIRQGRARWFRKRLHVRVEEAAAPQRVPVSVHVRRKGVSVYALAKANGVDIERQEAGGGWMVYPTFCSDDDDPHRGDHFAYDQAELWARVREYVALKERGACVS